MAIKRPILRVYGCGGMGAKFVKNHVLRMVESTVGKTNAFAEIKPAVLDTSKSNLDGLEGVENYILRGADGSGKKRDTNYAALKDRANEILQGIIPGDFNIVVHSASGGSGSVLSGIIVNELLSRGIPTIVFCVASVASDLEAENAYKTILGYEQMASRIRKLPVPMVYFQNYDTKTPEEIDNTLAVYLPMLAGIFSGANQDLDSMDIQNFLFYNKTSDYAPALTLLDLFTGEIELPQGESILSLLTLVKPGVATPQDVMVRYQATGIMNQGFAEAQPRSEYIRVAMISNHFHSVITGLQATRDRFAEATAKAQHRRLVETDLDSEDDGLIL